MSPKKKGKATPPFLAAWRWTRQALIFRLPMQVRTMSHFIVAGTADGLVCAGALVLQRLTELIRARHAELGGRWRRPPAHDRR
jgi:hypothetical protein